MASLNRVNLIGRLWKDPEIKMLNGGCKVANFTLSTSEKYKDKQGNKQEKSEWHRIVVWNKLADLVEQYLSKGKQIYLEGSLKTNEWTDKDGNKRYTTEIIGNSIQFLDKKQNDRNNQKKEEYKNGNHLNFDHIENDITF